MPNINQLAKQRPSYYEKQKNRHQVETGSSKFSSDEGQAMKTPNKISYYNLNKIQREHKMMHLANNTSAKTKYERLKKLIEQI